MCVPVGAAIIGSAILGAGTAAYSASKASKASKAANASNEKIAAANAQSAETAFNKEHQKAPDIAAMFARNREDGAKGIGATFLTGPTGTGPGILGKSTLLGG